MNILVLNGSPKGETSVTMQYMLYYKKCFREHTFTFVNAAFECIKYEKNPAAFQEVLVMVDTADMVIWAFPLYVMLVHSQYKRFIELIFERNAEQHFNGTYAVSFSTSIHFFDHTAHEYIRSICDDLGMKYIDGIPAHMRTLMEKENLSSLQRIFVRWERYVREAIPVSPIHPKQPDILPCSTPNSADALPFPMLNNTDVKAIETSKRSVLVVDLEKDHDNLKAMTDRVKRLLPNIQVMDIRSLTFSHCLGCLQCGPDNICAYEGTKDRFIEEFRTKIQPADIVIFAGAMHDRYLSSVWQRFAERCFFNTHQPYLTGKQVAFVISGPLSYNHNARQILTAYAEVWESNLVGIVTDEWGAENNGSTRLDTLISDAVYYAEHRTMKPQSFLGHAGMKIFRDDIFGPLRLVFQADHRYYRRNGMYDFPQRNIGVRLLNVFAIPLTKLPFIKKRFRKNMRSVMTMPYRRIIENAERVV